MALELRPRKAGRTPSALRLLGWLFVLCALVMLLKTVIDAYRESEQAKWPVADATITQEAVRRFTSGRHEAWRIESEVRYVVDGEMLTSTIHSRAGGFTEERAMRRWTSQHPPGTSLPVRFDPQHHNTAVPDAGTMPESGPQVPDDLKAILVFAILSAVLLTGDLVLRRRRESEGPQPQAVR